jgi:putative transposase
VIVTLYLAGGLGNRPDPRPYGHAIGVDMGLEKFLATRDGMLVKPPRFFKHPQNKLKLLQRRLSRKQKRSKNYEKQRIRVSQLHHQIDNKDLSVRVHHCLECGYTIDRIA